MAARGGMGRGDKNPRGRSGQQRGRGGGGGAAPQWGDGGYRSMRDASGLTPAKGGAEREEREEREKRGGGGGAPQGRGRGRGTAAAGSGARGRGATEARGRGGAGKRYTGAGWRIVKCFPDMARREADQAVSDGQSSSRTLLPPHSPTPNPTLPNATLGPLMIFSRTPALARPRDRERPSGPARLAGRWG